MEEIVYEYGKQAKICLFDKSVVEIDVSNMRTGAYMSKVIDVSDKL